MSAPNSKAGSNLEFAGSSRDEWVAAAAEALRPWMPQPAEDSDNETHAYCRRQRHALAEALADALLPEVAETRVEWGVRWANPRMSVMPASDKRSAEAVADYYDNGHPVVVSRVVTVGPWEVAP